MRRATLDAGVLVFAGLGCAQAVAQGIPEEALKKLRHDLGGSFLVTRDKVQEELKLTDQSSGGNIACLSPSIVLHWR